VLANGPSLHSGSSSSQVSHHPPLPTNGHSYHARTLPPPPPRAPLHPYSPPHQMNAPAAHMPPPPPWEVKWTRPVPAPASALPPPVSAAPSLPASSSSTRRLSVSSTATAPNVNDDKRLPAVDPLTPPSASRKRKYPEGDAASERASPYGSPSFKRHTPVAEPLPPAAPTPSSSSSSSSSSSAPAPASAPPGHRATQTLSPSLAMIMSPDTHHVPYVGTSTAALPATPPQQQRKVKLTYTNGEGTPR
jgi:[histone H3]-trimethyl-L-lysine4 demethylase